MSTKQLGRRVAAPLALVLAVAAAPPRVSVAQGARLASNVRAAAPTLLERRARFHVRNVALVDALRELEQRSGVPLAYSPSLLPAHTIVSCACAAATVREAVEVLLSGSAFTYREMDGQLLVVPAGSESPARNAAVDSAIITGTVSTEAGTPIAAAIVTIRSLRVSGTTSETGTYRLNIPPDRFVARSETLHVNRLGYRPADVAFNLVPGRVLVNVAMSPQAVALDQIVVTGTAGNQERRAQAAVVSSIDASEIMAKAPVRDVNELLTARTAGVTLTKGSGTSGANTRIDIRGQASVSLSNYPLIFVDGVRLSAGARGVAQAPGGTTAGAGGQQFSALNDLNPDDIESIEIVKGPAASTLYGADASAGVIQILTKKGKVGRQRFTQSVTGQYDQIDPDFTPYTNFGKCTAALIAATSLNPLCKGQTVGFVVSDNPLVRNDVYNNGWGQSLLYNAQGGGENFGYFLSLSGQEEQGTVSSSRLKHRTGRVNVNWTATPKLRIDVNVGLSRSNDRLPQGDQSSFSYMIQGDFGSPLSVTSGANGQITGGMFNNNATFTAIDAIQTRDLSVRSNPSIQVQYAPFSWLNNRVTVGGDLLRLTASQFFPKNDKNWYSAIANTGSLQVIEQNINLYTVDYLGNINKRFGRDGWISSDLSFGTQWINTVNTSIVGNGQGLLTNSNNLLSAATTSSVGQGFAESRSFGVLAQEQIGFRDRLYLQLGARIDRNSAFGDDYGSFFLPKAGISWVVSDESFWKGIASSISTFRVRTAYGTTGRSPSGTAALQTYSRANFVTDAGVVQPGVAPGSPGNKNLKPERGTEFEAGFDAGFFADRAGLEVTYFSKISKDLLLTQPLAPSSGFSSSPLVNIGEVSNKGLEVSLRATPVDRSNFRWDAQLNLTTLKNRIESMGAITPFISNNQCFKPGVEVAAYCVPRVVSVDTVARRVVVSDTARLVGGQLPKLSGSINTTLTLFRNLRLFAQLDGKYDYFVYNLTRDFRDRSLANSGEANLAAGQGGYLTYERLRRFGPFVSDRTGAAVGTSLVRDPYTVAGDFTRFRELSVTYTLPATLSRQLRVAGSSISVGARNIALWTDYDGWDPEVLGTPDGNTPNLADVFTLPQAKRMYARFNIQF